MTKCVRCAECRSTIPRRELARIAERLVDAGIVEVRTLCDTCCERRLRSEGIRMDPNECQRDYAVERVEGAELVRAAERNLDDVRGRCRVAIADAEGWLSECRRRLAIVVQRIEARAKVPAEAIEAGGSGNA